MIYAAYISENGFNGLRGDDAKRLTHVNFAFALVKEGKASVAHWQNSNAVRLFIKDKKHLKVVLSVGGWGAGGFSPAVSTAESREIFASSLMDIVNDYGFDGIDMDWEYPGLDEADIEASPDDKVNYTLFMELLRNKLGKDKILSMAAGGHQRCIDNLELDKLMEIMDFINLMTYDIQPKEFAGHHTALYSNEHAENSGDNVVKMFEAAGVKKSQMVLGAAFYARHYKEVDGIGSKSAYLADFLEDGYIGVKGFVGNYGLLYDEVAEAAFSHNKDGNDFITFDDPRSLKAKVKYIKKNGLLGIMFWEYTLDDDESTLLKAISEN